MKYKKGKSSKGRVDRDVTPKRKGKTNAIMQNYHRKSDSTIDSRMNKFKKGSVSKAGKFTRI